MTKGIAMKTLVTLLVAVALSCGAVFSIAMRPHAMPTELGLDWWALPVLVDPETAQCLRNRQRLEWEQNEIRARTAAKRGLAAEVAAGRLPLLEAAARFRDLNARTPGLAEHVCNASPGVSYELLLCQQVIAITEAVLEEQSPGQAEEIVARLRAELQQHLDRHGAIVLRRKNE
jgi:hypothetical protein